MSDFSSSFILIGERLNTHRERFRTIVVERNAETVLREVRRQIKAGVTHVDVNTSADAARESADMLWLLDTILPEIPKDVGIVIDSAKNEVQAAALEKLAGRQGTIINSNSADNERILKGIELAAKHKAGVIAILANSAGKTGLTPDRLKRADDVHAWMTHAGIPDERQFFDPQVLPLAFDPNLSRTILSTVHELHQRWPDAHVVVGLSNVSFNMPRRALLNQVYLAMLLANGLDAVICDPCGVPIHETLYAGQALLGQDEYFATYLSAFTPED
ncbi:MAG TPA: dihydropteroate synthase [Planctomycetota bacterium]|nr:dihydropteroate synthase [Planctomycetota bacterium]